MARTVAYGRFEWDREKAWRNLTKHKVSFEEAATVFDDLFFFAFEDLKHSLDEDCMLSLALPREAAF